jgi:hypothetical protein
VFFRRQHTQTYAKVWVAVLLALHTERALHYTLKGHYTLKVHDTAGAARQQGEKVECLSYGQKKALASYGTRTARTGVGISLLCGTI